MIPAISDDLSPHYESEEGMFLNEPITLVISLCNKGLTSERLLILTNYEMNEVTSALIVVSSLSKTQGPALTSP